MQRSPSAAAAAACSSRASAAAGRPLAVAPPRRRRSQRQAAAATAAPPSPSSSSSEASSSGRTLEVAAEYSGDAFADLVRMAQAADPSLPSPAAAAACSSAGPPPEALPLSNKPHWLRQRGAQGERYEYLKQQMGGLRLATVCEEAQCPNIGECWNGGDEGIGTATIMLLGDTCTRGCRFCAVNTSQAPPPPDPMEPEHTAQVGGAVGGQCCLMRLGRRSGMCVGNARSALRRAEHSVQITTDEVLGD